MSFSLREDQTQLAESALVDHAECTACYAAREGLVDPRCVAGTVGPIRLTAFLELGKRRPEGSLRLGARPRTVTDFWRERPLTGSLPSEIRSS